MASLTVADCRWSTKRSNCCNKRNLVALSLDANSFTTHGTTRRWYSTAGSWQPSCSSGGNTALPASPNSKAANNCGRILNRPTPSGNESNCAASCEKNRPFSPLSFIWISSRNSKASTRSFLKKPPLLRQRAITSAGFGLPSGLAPVNSRYTVVICFGILKNRKSTCSLYRQCICDCNNNCRQLTLSVIFRCEVALSVPLLYVSQIKQPSPHMSTELFFCYLFVSFTC